MYQPNPPIGPITFGPQNYQTGHHVVHGGMIQNEYRHCAGERIDPLGIVRDRYGHDIGLRWNGGPNFVDRNGYNSGFGIR